MSFFTEEQKAEMADRSNSIQQLSHSRMKTWEQCPRKAKYKFIDKLKEPGSEAMDRGLAVHKQIEEWIKGGCADKCPPAAAGRGRSIMGYISQANANGADIHTELQVAVNADWKRTEWFGHDVYQRVVYDLLIIHEDYAMVADHKTGKVYDDHEQQMELYAASVMSIYGVDEVECVIFYLDQNHTQSCKYDSSNLDALKRRVDDRARVIMSDRTFATNPSYKCRWCHFRKENGGPCPH